jgi:hypothetical protein
MKKFNCVVGALSAAVIAVAALAAAGCANNALKAPDIRAADSGAPGGERGAFRDNGGSSFSFREKPRSFGFTGAKIFPTKKNTDASIPLSLRRRRT